MFRLTGKDKKKQAHQIASYNLFHSSRAPTELFTAELRADGRINVFGRFSVLEEVRLSGEAALRYTEIRYRPAG